jgi:uncharacterized protein
MRRPAYCTVLAVALMAGCASSPPVRYHILSERPADTQLTMPQDMIPVRLDRLTIPTELDRSQIVRRIDSTRVQISEDDRWAAPLEDMIRRILTSDLAARLPPGQVADPNEPASTGERRQSLSVDIEEFYGNGACEVTLRAAWVLKRPDLPAVRGRELVRVPADNGCSGAAALPAPMSQALAMLSDRLASVIARGGL